MKTEKSKTSLVPPEYYQRSLQELRSLCGLKAPTKGLKASRRKTFYRSPRPEDELLENRDSAFSQVYFLVSVEEVFNRRGWVGSHIVWGALRRRLATARFGSLEARALRELAAARARFLAAKAALKSAKDLAHQS